MPDTSNPLLAAVRDGRLPAFSDIRPGQVLPALEVLLEEYREGVKSYLGMARKSGWELVEAETAWADSLARAWSPVSHLNAVADSDELREVYNAGRERLTAHGSWRQQHAGLFGVYRALADDPGFPELDAARRRIVELELRDFHLAGVDLPPAKQAEYREIVLRLSKLAAQFSENLLDATRAWTRYFDTPEALDGLPETELELLRDTARQSGRDGWTVDLNAPSFHAVMTHATDRELRHEVYRAYVTRASDQGPNAGQWDNAPVITEMLALRRRLARLFDFDNYVEYALSTRMADRPDEIRVFLERLAERARPHARAQLEELSAFAGEQGAELPLQAWDLPFWSERFRQQRIGLADEELKPYFPLDRMLGALHHVSGELFGVRLVEDPGMERWHPDARFYWLEGQDGRRFAGLYMDLFARRDKRGGAWMDVCQSLCGDRLPVAYLTCNFAPPAGRQPSLLTHHDVQTLFHEFGHCLHHLLTRVAWPQVNGINNVEWDAVELPSQLLENWCWTDEVLSRFARHYETGEPLPGELKTRLLRSRHFQKALFLVRQLEYGLCDLRLHLEQDGAEPLEVLESVRREVAVVPVPEWNRFLNGFSHIFGGGYAAGYYSYLWAEQLAADAWGRFLEDGHLDPDCGEALRREILSVGASRPALESFVAFRGRPPEPGPLLETYGLNGEK